MVRHIRRAHRAEENGVALFKLIQPALGDVVAVFLVVLAAPRVMRDVEFKTPVALREYVEHFKSGGNDFNADAVTGDGGDFVGTHIVFDSFSIRVRFCESVNVNSSG